MIINIKNNIEDIIKTNRNSNISLKEYLIGIQYTSKDFNMKNEIRISDFITILDKAFSKVPNSSFHDEIQFSKKPPMIDEEDGNYNTFKDILFFQINDLSCIEKDESLINNELKYFGIDSQNGNRWYNFNPFTYLKCASSWLVDYYGESSHIDYISWGMFAIFLEMGRSYE
ncbi:hypothetical protein SH1V18_05340 [Vallitalea longa]|uniref:Uncharacterized protein n=1 Tax=Vallitalea longa TaxID=2936439 RepID=A0A9W6DEX8_9FIRM|nr:hypothetical protein [Vallitalea longa]GKX28054.1 hypothetical protein SH1V18_05340 [Vallitalea longa]